MSASPFDQSRFTAVLLQKNGKYFLYQPALGVIASGASVVQAYEKFTAARRDLIENVDIAGLTPGKIPVTAPPRRARRTRPAGRGIVGELSLFLVKTCIILLIIGIIGAAGVRAAWHSVARFGTIVQELANREKSLPKFSLVDAIDKAAQHAEAMPEARKEELRQSIGILSREAQPLINAWNNPPPPVSAAPSESPPPSGK